MSPSESQGRHKNYFSLSQKKNRIRESSMSNRDHGNSKSFSDCFTVVTFYGTNRPLGFWVSTEEVQVKRTWQHRGERQRLSCNLFFGLWSLTSHTLKDTWVVMLTVRFSSAQPKFWNSPITTSWILYMHRGHGGDTHCQSTRAVLSKGLLEVYLSEWIKCIFNSIFCNHTQGIKFDPE